MTGEDLKDTADGNAEAPEAGCCSGKGVHSHKLRTDDEKKKLLNRLRRAEGQIRGIERMVEENAYCPDIMVQIQAAISASLTTSGTATTRSSMSSRASRKSS